jgi:D-alanyl-D-alanine carboxypeptidase (penicillin-binding protein 5/6)
LPRGAQVGEVEVRQRGAVVARIPLVTGAAIDAPTTMEQLADVVDRERTALTLGLVGVASLLGVLLWGRATRRRRSIRTRET